MAVTERTRRTARETQTRFELDADRLVELDRRHKLPGFAPLDEHARDGSMLIVRGKGVFFRMRAVSSTSTAARRSGTSVSAGQAEVAGTA